MESNLATSPCSIQISSNLSTASLRSTCCTWEPNQDQQQQEQEQQEQQRVISGRCSLTRVIPCSLRVNEPVVRARSFLLFGDSAFSDSNLKDL